MSFVLLSSLIGKADTKVPCFIFSGNAEKEHSIDLSKFNRITFGKNSMVISSSKDDTAEPIELSYSLYHRLVIGDAEPTATQAESITLSQETTTLKVGESVKLTATVLPENTKDKTVTWTSSDESIAMVDTEGQVKAVALGTATITATCGSVSATCSVTVVETPAESVTISQKTATLKVGETVGLTATVLPENATDKTVTWTSSNNSVATVDAKGKVIAVALGTATITATCGSVNATCSVTVVATPAESVTISHKTATLRVGGTVGLTATVLPENTTDKTVTWTSSDKSIATVDAKGKVTAVALGTATITATCGSVNATCSVTVVATPAESVTISQKTATLKVGETIGLTATVLPENATDKTVTWTSSDKSIATVDAEGKVTAISIGETNITASCGSVKAVCAVTVVADPGGVDAVDVDSETCIYVDALSKLLYIKSASDSVFSVRIFNVNGHLLQTSELCNDDSMTLETLAPGVYLAVATDGKINLNLKFILN